MIRSGVKIGRRGSFHCAGSVSSDDGGGLTPAFFPAADLKGMGGGRSSFTVFEVDRPDFVGVMG
jgi:hypothetical protein